MVSQEEKKGENGGLVFIYFEMRKLDWMLIMNFGICL